MQLGALVLVYAGGGIAYNSMVEGKSGLAAMPNLDFWLSTGGLLQVGSLPCACVLGSSVVSRVPSVLIVSASTHSR